VEEVGVEGLFLSCLPHQDFQDTIIGDHHHHSKAECRLLLPLEVVRGTGTLGRTTEVERGGTGPVPQTSRGLADNRAWIES